MSAICTGKIQFLTQFRIAAFKKVKGPEVHEMDRSVFKDRLYSKIYRKKKFNFTKKKFTPKPFASSNSTRDRFKKQIEERRRKLGRQRRSSRDRSRSKSRERHRDRSRDRGRDRSWDRRASDKTYKKMKD